MRGAILGTILLAGAIEGAASQPLVVPFVGQQKNGCGAASVAMVMQYWDHRAPSPPAHTTANQVYQRLYNPERKGILLGDMKHYFEESGFLAFTFRGKWADVEEHIGKGRPVIVTLKPKRRAPAHFIVVTEAASDYVSMNDPTRKRMTRLKRVKFEKQWDNAGRWMLLATPQSRSPSSTSSP